METNKKHRITRPIDGSVIEKLMKIEQDLAERAFEKIELWGDLIDLIEEGDQTKAVTRFMDHSDGYTRGLCEARNEILGLVEALQGRTSQPGHIKHEKPRR